MKNDISIIQKNNNNFIIKGKNFNISKIIDVIVLVIRIIQIYLMIKREFLK